VRAERIVPKLAITGFINADLYDGSSLIQASAEYYLSRSWTIGRRSMQTQAQGTLRTLAQSLGALVKLVRYF